MDFPYGETEIAYLRARDLKLGAAMERIGPIHREVDPDLFSSVIHHIIGQPGIHGCPADSVAAGSRAAGRDACAGDGRGHAAEALQPWA